MRVAELENTATFYSTLGLQLTQEYGENAMFFAGGEYHHHIGVNTWQSAGAGPLPEDTAGLRYFEIIVENKSVLDEIKTALEQSRNSPGRERIRVIYHRSERYSDVNSITIVKFFL